MEIYLVRVEQQNEKLSVERKLGTTDDDYIAISHVWGDPETIQGVNIEGLGIVQLSPIKRSHDILSILSRSHICGKDWFWMDLFCIDQNENASISITNQLMAIPAIYKSSQCVKVLLETPVCKTWHQEATSWPHIASEDEQTNFEAYEMMHSRKCSNMVFLDPWFDRLWTRQEGLYALQLQFIILNPVECQRAHAELQSGNLKWNIEKQNKLKRDSAYNFFDDKLRYHGIESSRSMNGFKLHHSCAYNNGIKDENRNILDIIEDYGGVSGPVAGYSPIDGSWRSGRRTSKVCDYVLAVLPDVKGYRVPDGARKLKFEELLENAFQQLEILGLSGAIGVKVASGVTSEAVQCGNSFGVHTPLGIPDFPKDVTEAFDCLAAVMPLSPGYSNLPSMNSGNVSNTLRCGTTTFTIASSSVYLSPLVFNKDTIYSIVQQWSLTADFYTHIGLCAPSGPCLGKVPPQDNDLEAALHRYLAFQFIKPLADDQVSKGNNITATKVAIVDIDAVARSASDKDFALYFKHFMVCLICGVTLRTAAEISNKIEFRIVKTSTYGFLLALVNKKFLSDNNSATKELYLITRGLHRFEGFHLAVEDGTGGSCCIIGRTWIPQPSKQELAENATLERMSNVNSQLFYQVTEKK